MVEQLIQAGQLAPQYRTASILFADIEALNKEFRTDCLISGSTFEAARSSCIDAVAMGTVQVRGRESAVEVFALGEPSRR